MRLHLWKTIKFNKALKLENFARRTKRKEGVEEEEN